MRVGIVSEIIFTWEILKIIVAVRLDEANYSWIILGELKGSKMVGGVKEKKLWRIERSKDKN